MSLTRRYLMLGALRQMWRFPLRSLLVVLCAALGVAGAITAVNYASGGREQVLDQIRQLGTNLVIVSAEQSRAVAGRERTGGIVTTLVEEDYRALTRELDDVVRSSALVVSPLRLKAGFLSKVVPVVGVEPAYFAMKWWRLEAGELFDEDDLRRSARLVLLGYGVADDLYPDESAIGQTLFINRVPFQVAGVLAERGPGMDGSNEDQQVYVPLTTAMRRLMNVTYYNAILLEVSQPAALSPALQDATALLRVRHRISPFRPDDFRVQSQQDLIDTQLASADRLAFLVRWIGVSALVVSGIGILAIAWIGVRDRITEIGTRRALGATAPDVFFQFTFEAAVLAGLGVAAGVGAGWLASRITAAQVGLPFVFDQANALLAVVIALVLNLLFASGPALRAARLDPIRALKHE